MRRAIESAFLTSSLIPLTSVRSLTGGFTVNYIELINNFWIQHRRFHFNEKEISMFFFLLDRANELFWPESFSMPCSVFRKEFGWTRNQVRWARSKLIETDIISYSPGDKGRNGKYSFTVTFLRASSTQCVSNPCALSAHSDELIETTPELEERSSEMCNCEDSTRKSCADHAQLSREPRTRTLYINKTRQNKTKKHSFSLRRNESFAFGFNRKRG